MDYSLPPALASRFGALCCVLVAFCVAACTLPAGFSAAATPRPTRVLATQSAPAPTPRASADPRVPWPPDVSAFLPPGAVVVDVSEMDTDGDGVKELLVMYTLAGVGHGRVIRRELPGGRAYELGGSKPVELFAERWADNIIADVNADGHIEIVVAGIISGSAEELNVFQWNGSDYGSLLSLSGPEGVAVEDPQQDGNLQFTALELPFPRSAISRSTHAAWRDGAYRQWSDLHFLIGPPLRFNYPEQAVLAYYEFWRAAMPGKMFAMLAGPQQASTSLAGVTAQVHSLADIALAAVRVDDEQTSSATVTAEVRMLPLGGGPERTATHLWQLVNLDDGWHLAELKQP